MPEKKSLGKFLQEELGGDLIGDVTDELEGSYKVEIENMPEQITRTKINETIVEFYESIGFTKDKHSKLEDPVFYKEKENSNVRCICLTDNRGLDYGTVLISVAPLYSTND